jgi:hypothetical protein
MAIPLTLRIIASIDSYNSKPMNCVSAVLSSAAKSSRRFGHYGHSRYYGSYGNLLDQVVAQANEKTSFLSLRTYISDSMPAVWSTDTHVLFPAKFQVAVHTLLLSQCRLRGIGMSSGLPVKANFGHLNLFLLSKVLQYLAQCTDYTDGVVAADTQQLVVQVYMQDRLVQPNVDINCSKVLWGALGGPKVRCRVFTLCMFPPCPMFESHALVSLETFGTSARK